MNMMHGWSKIECLLLLLIFSFVPLYGESFGFFGNANGRFTRRISSPVLNGGDFQPPNKPPRSPTRFYSRDVLSSDNDKSILINCPASKTLFSSLGLYFRSLFRNSFFAKLWARLCPSHQQILKEYFLQLTLILSIRGRCCVL